MSEDFFDDPNATNATEPESSAPAARRRRTRTIALVALGSAAALGTYAYMTAPPRPVERVVDANGQQAMDANGQPVTQHRNSYLPWIWMMSRGGGMFGGGSAAPMPGATSGFNAGGGTATAGRTGTAPGGTSGTATSRGGFGSFGRALSGAS